MEFYIFFLFCCCRLFATRQFRNYYTPINFRPNGEDGNIVCERSPSVNLFMHVNSMDWIVIPSIQIDRNTVNHCLLCECFPSLSLSPSLAHFLYKLLFFHVFFLALVFFVVYLFIVHFSSSQVFCVVCFSPSVRLSVLLSFWSDIQGTVRERETVETLNHSPQRSQGNRNQLRP